MLAPRKVGGPQMVGAYVGVVDVEGYLHLLAASDGAYVGRTATDGSAPSSQPVGMLGGAVWQSSGGNLIRVTAR